METATMTTGAGERPTVRARRVLVVDDDAAVRRLVVRALAASGYDVRIANDGQLACKMLRREGIDLVVTDLHMPRIGGLELLQSVREMDEELPVIVLTGEATATSAIVAVNLRAAAYLQKPISTSRLIEEVDKAMLRRATSPVAGVSRASAETQRLTLDFERALRGVFMVYQPIVRWSQRRVFGFESLVRSQEPALPNPGALFHAAERLDRLPDLGRRIRQLCAVPLALAPRDAALFVNLHPLDLLDETLYDPASQLARIGERVVLELTERAQLGHVDDLSGRMARLRELGFSIAVDDMGAGYSGLNSFALLRPDFVKLDLSLVRGVDTDPLKQRLVSSLTSLCVDMGVGVVAEGVETVAERDALVALGCDLLQGFLFAKPGFPFPAPAMG